MLQIAAMGRRLSLPMVAQALEGREGSGLEVVLHFLHLGLRHARLQAQQAEELGEHPVALGHRAGHGAGESQGASCTGSVKASACAAPGGRMCARAASTAPMPF